MACFIGRASATDVTCIMNNAAITYSGTSIRSVEVTIKNNDPTAAAVITYLHVHVYNPSTNPLKPAYLGAPEGVLNLETPKKVPAAAQGGTPGKATFYVELNQQYNVGGKFLIARLKTTTESPSSPSSVATTASRP